MTHVRVQQYGSGERLAAAAELAEFRAQGLRPAPRRQLAPVRRAYAAWPVLVTVAGQFAALAGSLAVAR